MPTFHGRSDRDRLARSRKPLPIPPLRDLEPGEKDSVLTELLRQIQGDLERHDDALARLLGLDTARSD